MPIACRTSLSVLFAEGMPSNRLAHHRRNADAFQRPAQSLVESAYSLGVFFFPVGNHGASQFILAPGGNHDRAFVHLVWPPTSGFTALNSRTPALPYLSPIWIPSAGPRTNSIVGTLRGVNDNRAFVYVAPHDEIYRSVRHRRLAPTMAHSPANRPRTRSRVALHVSPRVAPFPVKSASGAHA